MSLHEITRRAPGKNISLLTPAIAAAALRGVMFQESATAGIAELADGTRMIAGHVTRDVNIGGPVLGDIIYPNRTELPFTATQEASFERSEQVEVEGASYIDASVTAGTAIETQLSFLAGKFSTVGSGQRAFYVLREVMTPETAGNLRIRVQRATDDYVKP